MGTLLRRLFLNDLPSSQTKLASLWRLYFRVEELNNFWDKELVGKKELLRLLTRDGKWLRWEGEKEDPNRKPKAGCKDQVEEALLAALHSTNVVVLLGSGASFSAKNNGGPNAPGMRHLWEAVKNGFGDAAFNEIAQSVVGHVPAEGEENIEALLSLCKMSVELLEVRVEKKGAEFPDRARLEKLKEFVATAERAILAQVGFVRSDTELPAHTGFLRKFARRSPEKPRVKLFTTNYDLCIETAGLRLGVVLIDGFSHSAEQRFNRDHFDMISYGVSLPLRRPTTSTVCSISTNCTVR